VGWQGYGTGHCGQSADMLGHAGFMLSRRVRQCPAAKCQHIGSAALPTAPCPHSRLHSCPVVCTHPADSVSKHMTSPLAAAAAVCRLVGVAAVRWGMCMASRASTTRGSRTTTTSW
jgi:hypothetical protein